MISPRVFRLVCIIIENRVDSEGISDFLWIDKDEENESRGLLYFELCCKIARNC